MTVTQTAFWLIFVSLVAIVSIMFGVLFLWAGVLRTKQKRELRPGFEVKTNTGEEPVIKERRENDHG